MPTYFFTCLKPEKLDFKQPYATNYKQKEIYVKTEIKQNPQAHSQSIMPLKIPLNMLPPHP